MTTYLYCVLAPARADELPRGLTGIGAAPVRSLVSEQMGVLEAWVATIAPAALRVTGEALAAQALMHNEIVNAALQTGRTPAPARYGSRFENDAACIADLASRADLLRDVLHRVAGSVEMPVLIVPSAPRAAPLAKPDPGEPAAGRRYLEAVRTQTRESERFRSMAELEADRVMLAVRGIIRDETRSYASSGVLSVAHLVPRDALARYHSVLAAISPGDSFRLVIGEPRAPYSFAGSNSGSAGHDSSKPTQNE